MKLVPFWFIVIAFLWTGFFVLEGFDFGVGMLHSVVGKDEAGRRAAINTIGPLWDGNEVWLIVAGAAMFAAFPGWYATMFSGLYLALVLLLMALIIRGVAFEYRGKRDAARWRRTWDVLLTESGRQPWIVQGIMLTKNGISPTVSTTWLWISVVGFVLLYGALGTVDFILMLRYSRNQLPPARTDADADAPVPAVQY